MSKEIVHVADTFPVAASAYTVTNRSVLVSFAKETVHMQHEEGSPRQLEHLSVPSWFVTMRFDHDAFINYARQINEAAQLLMSATKADRQPTNYPFAKQDTVLEKYAAMYEDKVNEDDKQPPQDRDAEQPAPQSHSREMSRDKFEARAEKVRRAHSVQPADELPKDGD